VVQDEDGGDARTNDATVLEKVIEDNERRFENERYEGTKKLDLRTI
jgi:hypothetical protein